MQTEAYDLERFVAAQEFTFQTAVTELRAGRKRSHWMWFVFPQLRGLGSSARAQFYGLADLEEAVAYQSHALLGPRLVEAVAAVEASDAPSLHDLLGSPDDLKFRSSMTLFDAAEPNGPYGASLERWCDGVRDSRTLALLKP